MFGEGKAERERALGTVTKRLGNNLKETRFKVLLEYILWFLTGSWTVSPNLKALFDYGCEVKGKHGKPKNICTKY